LINRSRFLVNEDPFDSMSAQLFYGALLFLPFSIFGSIDLFTPSTDMLGRLLLLGLFATAIGHSVYFWSLRYVSATKASLFTLLEPVYGIAFGMLLFKEYPDQTMMMGASVVIITAGLISLFSTVLTDENDEILNEKP
jgi:drug/metabolite transporter (DMT)-like permease